MPWRNAINSTKFPRVQGASRLGLDRLGLDRFGLDRLSSYRANRKAFSPFAPVPGAYERRCSLCYRLRAFGYDAGVRRGQDRHARRQPACRRAGRGASIRRDQNRKARDQPCCRRSGREATVRQYPQRADADFHFHQSAEASPLQQRREQSPKRWWRPACPNIQRRSARSVLFRSSFFITPTSIVARPCPTWNASPGQAWRCTRA